ncbi:MAG: hypothetical protein WAK34_15970, partial [Rhodoplanes sp.]
MSRARITRTGMIFNWVPDRILFITEPEHNAVTALTLGNGDKVFRLNHKRTFTALELNTPVDLTPAVPEVANPGFASNTTLAQLRFLRRQPRQRHDRAHAAGWHRRGRAP